MINYNLYDLEVFTPGLASLKWEKVKICFVFAIYTIKWNQANLSFKMPKLIISLTQSDRYDNQLNLWCKLVTDWNGYKPNLSWKVYLIKRIKMGLLQDKNSSLLDQLGKLLLIYELKLPFFLQNHCDCHKKL